MAKLNRSQKIELQKTESTTNEFFGTGWSVREENGKFFFHYISGSLAGNTNEIEIKEEDYLAARNGKITFDELCIKYDVS